MTDARPTTTRAVDLAARLDGSLAAIEMLRPRLETVRTIGGAIAGAFAAGRTLYTCGNGGSAAEALHLAEELIGRYRGDRPPCRAVSLNADATALTCIANDFGYDTVFARQAEALVGPGDVLVALTTSGNSPNVVNALRVARDNGGTTVGLLGRDGGACADLCDHAIIIPATESAHIQEAHQVVIHMVCEMLE